MLHVALVVLLEGLRPRHLGVGLGVQELVDPVAEGVLALLGQVTVGALLLPVVVPESLRVMQSKSRKQRGPTLTP